MSPSLRASVIAEWRGLPANKVRPDRWQAPGDLLPKLIQQLGLSERGIPIARRTVAKYRTELNILPSNMRRKY